VVRDRSLGAMGLASLACTLALCLGLAQGVPSKNGFQALRPHSLHVAPRPHVVPGPHVVSGLHAVPGPQVVPGPRPANVFIQGVHQKIPDCPPEINSITEVKTITRTRDVFTTQVIPEIVYRTVYTTNVVTQTSNTVVTVTTSNVIRSNVVEVETLTKIKTAYTAVPTTFTETTTRTQFDIQYVTETAVVTRTVAEGTEEFVPVYVTETATAANPITQVTTSTIRADQAIAVTVTFTEQTTVPVVVTQTQTLPAAAVTSTVVNYVTNLVQVTQKVPVERVITHREIHTRTVTEQAAGQSHNTVYQTVCPVAREGAIATAVPAAGIATLAVLADPGAGVSLAAVNPATLN